MKFLVIIFFLTLFSACTKQAENKSTQPLSADELIQRGKAIYNLNCIACHNADPKISGALGPAIHGSSKELLEARVLYAKYPNGYKPQRDTSQMPAFAHLEKELPALYAFLNSQQNSN